MPTLTITAKGQVTLRKEVLRHLGVKPGDKIDVELLPNGKVDFSAAKPKRTGSLEDVFGMFGPWNGPPISIDEMNEIIAKGWAGELDDEDSPGQQHSASRDDRRRPFANAPRTRRSSRS